ncbi:MULTISPECIES: hypothetical protein [unclassified Enterococcus]|jgi:hypothetical protein|uniref:hypothetical protein n=1 Tax=unclassified Enterococcus TaxID=2608891 RepID=UPI003D2C9842
MKFLTKEEADKYIQEADELRTTYLNSNYYTRDVCDIIFQHLNLKENDCHTEFVYEFQTEIEFMALYQQLLDVCPEAFSDRKQELIKDSLQKSIYASIRPNLFPNYITELENNNRDSFLVIPVLLKNIPGSSELHGVTLILMKKENQLIVSIFDKAEERPGRNNSRITNYETQSRTTYRYTIENTEKNRLVIANILHLGLGYPKKENQVVENALMKHSYSLYAVFRTLAQEERLCAHIGRSQAGQGNCSINNLNSALKYVLGEVYPVKDLLVDGEKAVKTKYKDLTTEKYNSVIVQIAVNHLIKLKSSIDSTILLKDGHVVYQLLKKTRAQNDSKYYKLKEKLELCLYLRKLNRGVINLIPITPIKEKVMPSELNSIYKLPKDKINYIREESKKALKNNDPLIHKLATRKIEEVHKRIVAESQSKDRSVRC